VGVDAAKGYIHSLLERSGRFVAILFVNEHCS
jgi:hypothetical protein